jgi:hypothetical protein
MIKKYIGTGFVALGLLFSVGFASPAQASSLTSAQVSAIINLLQSFGADQNTINSVQVALGGSPSGSLSCSSFADLTYGNFDNNPGGRISQLQTFLGISSNTFGFGTYGRKTQAAWNNMCGVQTTTSTQNNTAPTNTQTTPASTSNPIPTLNFYAYPTTITSGQSSTLNWMTTNANSCVSTGSTMPYPLGTSGNIQVSPVKGAVYTLICTGLGGSVTQSVSVTVSVLSAPIITSVNGKGGFSTGDSNYILGQGFGTVREVYLQSSGGTKTSLSYTLVDDTRLNVVVPSVFGGTYQLYVTNQAGTSAPYSVGWIGAAPLPVISSVNGKGGFGSGDSNYILGQNFSTVNAVYLLNSNGVKTSLTYSLVDDTRLNVVVPALSGGNYYLYVTNYGGMTAYSVGYLGPAPLPLISYVNGKGGFGPGDSNSIFGQNFSTTKEVYLMSGGGAKTSLTYSIIDDTRLDVVVPSLPLGSYLLYVVNQGGNTVYSVNF